MARKLRVPYEGAIYHITCRWVGSWKDGDRELFRDDADRWRLLDVGHSVYSSMTADKSGNNASVVAQASRLYAQSK
jgi:hypothetical protein